MKTLTKSGNNNYSIETNDEKGLAPLLETISSLKNSLIYSDHSSNSSISNPDDLEQFDAGNNNQYQCQSLLPDNIDEFNVDNNSIEFDKQNSFNDIDNNNEDKNEPTNYDDNNDQPQSSRVRFNIDVQVNTSNSNLFGPMVRSSSASSLIPTDPNVDNGSPLSVNRKTENFNVTKTSSSSLEWNDCGTSSLLSKEDLTSVPLIPPNGSSSSSTSLNSSSQPSVYHSLIRANLQSTNQDNQQPDKSLIFSNSNYNNLANISNQQHQFKSILKDPLCAKLRRTLQSTSIDQEKDNSKLIQPHQKQSPLMEENFGKKENKSTNLSNLMDDLSTNKTKSTSLSADIIDIDQLESEIDQLLYGTCMIEDNNDNESVPNNYPETKINETISDTSYNGNNIDLVASTLNSINNNNNNNGNNNNQPPYQTYIKMIEEKYRQMNGKLMLNINSSTTTESNLKQIMSDNAKTRTSIGSGQQSSANLRQLNGKKSFHTNENLSKFTNDGIKGINNKIEILTPLLFQPYRLSIDHWMATLIQESGKKPQASISSMDKNIDLDSPNQSNENNNNNNNINIRQEELYHMLSDPINGPSINKLMDHLSKSWSFVENNTDHKNIIINNKNDNIRININDTNQFNKTNANLFNSKNSKKLISSRKTFDNISLLSSNSSNGSKTTTTTISPSLAENHIYEEILYEMFTSTTATNV